MPLTLALTQLGRHVRNGYAIFGVQLRLTDNREAAVTLVPGASRTLGEGLDQILRQLSDCELEVVSDHLVNIYPKGAKQDSASLLNVRVARFDVTGETAGRLLSWPQRFIPELVDRLVPKEAGMQRILIFSGAVGVGPTVTLHLRDVAVRQVLNAVAVATEKSAEAEPPLGWAYSFQPKPGTPAGGVHTWKYLNTVPTDWKRAVNKSLEVAPP